MNTYKPAIIVKFNSDAPCPSQETLDKIAELLGCPPENIYLKWPKPKQEPNPKQEPRTARYENLTGLKGIRKRAGLSQLELANRAGIGIGTILRIEKGKAPRDDERIIDRLAQVLDCSTDHVREGLPPIMPPRICVVCGSEIDKSLHPLRKTCSNECSFVHQSNQRGKPVLRKYKFSWTLQAPDGMVYHCDNLSQFVRDHADMFDGTVQQAIRGISAIKYSMNGSRKISVNQWKGWKLLEWEE